MICIRAGLCLWLGTFVAHNSWANPSTTKQESLDEWRSLTAPTAAPPRVFVKGNQVRFYFPTAAGVEEFDSEWSHGRLPSSGYRVRATVLRWKQKLSRMPEGERGWREAEVIAGQEWRRMATNLIAALAPERPMHGAYYQAFLADRVLYRDASGAARWAALNEVPSGVVIEHRFSMDETLEVLARRIEAHLVQSHPGDELFLLMAPNASRFTTPLLLDRQQKRCISLTPAALYDTTERNAGLTATAQGFSAFFLEGHGLALLKNPVSSAARLGDLGFQTVFRILRLPLPGPGSAVPPLNPGKGMDLVAWENWLDHYTGTRREQGTIKPLIDGDSFFDRFEQAVVGATNHIYLNIYIFDRDDVATEIADKLKQRSTNVDVRVIFDRMGSIAAGTVPPGTPMPEDYTPPKSISAYLKQGSKVHVRPFLNPWLSADHMKVCLIDGNDAWLGGMNLGREYRYEWHDLMVELQGPVVRSLEKEFSRCWAHEGLLGDLAYAAALVDGPEPKRFPEPTNEIALRLLPTKTAWKPFNAAVMEALNRAQRCVYIENPYLFDKHVIRATVRARQRGVDVRVILPRVNDFKAGGRSNMVIANYLLEHGVRVFFYPGMTHVKALLVDGWSCLGSGNLNHLSLRLNQEQNVATSDPSFAATLNHDLFGPDFARSYELKDTISVDWVDFLAEGVLENF